MTLRRGADCFLTELPAELIDGHKGVRLLVGIGPDDHPDPCLLVDAARLLLKWGAMAPDGRHTFIEERPRSLTVKRRPVKWVESERTGVGARGHGLLSTSALVKRGVSSSDRTLRGWRPTLTRCTGRRWPGDMMMNRVTARDDGRPLIL